jgi:hypothetical protein
MAFPKGSLWYADGFNEVGVQVDDSKYNPVTNAYNLTDVAKYNLEARQLNSELEKKYTVGVYNAHNTHKVQAPDYSVFVRIPKIVGDDYTGGYLSINISDIGSVTGGVHVSSDRRFYEGVLKKRALALAEYAHEFDGGGKKRSSRTRTIRKTRKRSVRRHRRTNNRRHRRNVKK